MNKKIHSFNMNKIILFMLLMFLGLPAAYCQLGSGVSCTSASGVIGGTVFLDCSENGVLDASDTIGLANIRVIAWDNAGTAVATTATNDIGAYELNVPADAITYRVEFDMIPTDLSPTFAGVNNGTTVQFTTAPNCTTDLGLNDKAAYMTNNPPVAVVCYVNGDPLGTPPADPTRYAGDMDVIVTLDWDDQVQAPAINKDVKGIDAGSVWGLAYNPVTQKLFSGAFVKRNCGLGTLGAGGIYVTDYSGGAPVTTPLVDVNVSASVNAGSTIDSNSDRQLTTDAFVAAPDQIFNEVFTEGLGDIDLSSDYNTLYATNLTEGNIIAIDLTTYNASGTPPGAGQISVLPALPNPGCPIPVPENQEVRSVMYMLMYILSTLRHLAGRKNWKFQWIMDV